MNAVKILAIVLIVAGILGLLYGKFSYTKETHDVKLGPARDVDCGKGDGQRPSLGRRNCNSGWWCAPGLCEQERVTIVKSTLRALRLSMQLQSMCAEQLQVHCSNGYVPPDL